MFRPVLAAIDKVPCERVFLWGDSNLQDLVHCDAGIKLFDAVPNHLVRASRFDTPSLALTLLATGFVLAVVVWRRW